MNFVNEFFAEEGLPFAKNVDECATLIYSNFAVCVGLAKINQHLPFHFNFILTPESYQAEWKVVLQQMLAYVNFKNAMEPKHLAAIPELASRKLELEEAHSKLLKEKHRLHQLQLCQKQNQEIADEHISETQAKQEQLASLQPQLESLKTKLE